MQNVRHLWTSVPPHGEKPPPQIFNRLGFRICDFDSDPWWLLAITAFIELLGLFCSSLDSRGQ